MNNAKPIYENPEGRDDYQGLTGGIIVKCILKK
jgi:hypothetical protein